MAPLVMVMPMRRPGTAHESKTAVWRSVARGVGSQLQAFAIAMTRAHSAVPLADAPDLDAATAVVRARGLRLSTARRLVLEALYDADGPLTAEQLAGEMDVASVYRNLETLEELGLVRHFHLGHGPGLYPRAVRLRGALHPFPDRRPLPRLPDRLVITRIRGSLTAAEWRRAAVLAAVIVALHVIGFFVLLAL